ncbi:MAG: DMT family transporter [Promethearchaeota archaeon]
MSRKKGIAALLLASICWAVPPAFSKFIGDEFSSSFKTVFRLLVSLIVFTPFLFTRENRKRIKQMKKKTLFYLIISGGIFFGPHYIFFFLALEFTLASHASVLLNMGYIISASLGIFFFKERITRKKIVSLVLSLLGVVLVAWPTRIEETTAYTKWGILLGDIFMIIYALMWAFYSIQNKKCLDVGVGNIPTTYFNFLFGMLVVLPFSIGDFALLPGIGITGLSALLGIAAFGSILGYFLYNVGVKDIENSKANIIMLSTPVFGVLLSVWLLGEVLSIFFIIGSALIIMSTFLIVRGPGGKNGKNEVGVAGDGIERVRESNGEALVE